MKRLSADAKLDAYTMAIEYLKIEECTYDTDEYRAARKWLADKLDKECDKWYSSIKTRDKQDIMEDWILAIGLIAIIFGICPVFKIIADGAFEIWWKFVQSK